ncbi:tRNA (N6-threonylcarbamoyladenosine(37)-N6)-methyltransferase TrmO [Thorsellia anophelis]|uniref:tRNA-Thr(GGU) m(6)t(6)A37 methyltransferase TsaA n=1 Tax=Thorsellia anophelis DSM 18579 TaxID=1123402 RepID=A0A1I0A0K8_9GAMM|nr:tRNA (N6-threonylcarbamoyladenosine(37)-N6)-methyltransferase TrmO [Thorsellia anophelis]SES87196.1 tRNA-Thr(GGU) m(6)t(6)A37 methyltransferase TsaA [Thorsellia anophelis DSM 18579]
MLDTKSIGVDRYEIVPIGQINTPFKQKFTVPRQPRLINLAKGVITLNKPFDDVNAVAALSSFSHVWVLFWFHLNPDNKSASSNLYKWQPMVRPPRLGGKEKVGVFASRSPFRPNPIGMSVFELESVECINGHVEIHVKGVDVVDGTPIIDIKPYIPFSDSINEAKGAFAQLPPISPFTVEFTPEANEQLERLVLDAGQSLEYSLEVKSFIVEILSQDPRPAYHKQNSEQQQYGVELLDYEIKWVLQDVLVTVTAFKLLK